MSAVPRLSTAYWLDELEAEIRRDHEQRLDVCGDIPLRRRGRRVKKRPRTAIISHAARETIRFKVVE